MPGSAAVQLASGVYRVPLAPRDALNAFAIRHDDGQVTLVDCGMRGGLARIARALRNLGGHPSEVTQIVVTHAHIDHAGGLARLRAQTAARVVAHERDAPYLRAGRSPARAGATLGGRLMGLLPSRYPPTEVTDEVVDGAALPGGLRVIHTPGHTPGHMSMLHEPTGVLIVGDVLSNFGGRLRWAPPGTCTDPSLTRRAAGALVDLDFGIAAFSHGTEVRDGARAALRSFVGTLERLH